MTLKQGALEEIVGKGEDAGDQHLLLFPQCFLPYQSQKYSFSNIKIVFCKYFHFLQGQNFDNQDTGLTQLP